MGPPLECLALHSSYEQGSPAGDCGHASQGCGGNDSREAPENPILILAASLPRPDIDTWLLLVHLISSTWATKIPYSVLLLSRDLSPLLWLTYVPTAAPSGTSPLWLEAGRIWYSTTDLVIFEFTHIDRPTSTGRMVSAGSISWVILILDYYINLSSMLCLAIYQDGVEGEDSRKQWVLILYVERP